MKRETEIAVAILFIAGLVVVLESAQADVRRGNSYFGEGQTYDLAKASSYYERALHKDPQARDAWHQLARIDFLRGDFDAALEKINKQIALHDDTLMSSHYIRGLIHGYRKEFAEAEADFKTFLAWDPENWAALNDLAWVYFAQGKFLEAQNMAERGLGVDPVNPWLLMMRGMSRFNLGDVAGAANDLVRAQREAASLTTRGWTRAYPGNDPRVAANGVLSMRAAITANIDLVHKKLAQETKRP